MSLSVGSSILLMQPNQLTCRTCGWKWKNNRVLVKLSVIRPIVTYACETWILKETIRKGKF